MIILFLKQIFILILNFIVIVILGEAIWILVVQFNEFSLLLVLHKSGIVLSETMFFSIFMDIIIIRTYWWNWIIKIILFLNNGSMLISSLILDRRSLDGNIEINIAHVHFLVGWSNWKVRQIVTLWFFGFLFKWRIFNLILIGNFLSCHNGLLLQLILNFNFLNIGAFI